MDLSVDMYLQIGDVDYGFDVHGIDHPDDVGNFKGGDYGFSHSSCSMGRYT